MRTIANTLLLISWFFRFGWECARHNFRGFLRSFTLMPGVLCSSYEKSVEDISTRMVLWLREAPLGESDAAAFKQHPMGYALMTAHRATLPIWFVPARRLDVIARVAPHVQRQWARRLGVEIGEPMDLFDQLD